MPTIGLKHHSTISSFFSSVMKGALRGRCVSVFHSAFRHILFHCFLFFFLSLPFHRHMPFFNKARRQRRVLGGGNDCILDGGSFLRLRMRWEKEERKRHHATQTHTHMGPLISFPSHVSLFFFPAEVAILFGGTADDLLCFLFFSG
jgi:hypothetical protein